MKTVMVIIAGIFSISTIAGEIVSCESLQEKAHFSCERAICAEMELEGYECIKDGDFFEGLQICAYEEFQDFLNSYNNNNPAKPLICEY